MGIKLSDMGCLTYSQKQSCGGDKRKETALFEKLKKLDINKPILKAVAEKTRERKEKSDERRATVAKPKTGRFGR